MSKTKKSAEADSSEPGSTPASVPARRSGKASGKRTRARSGARAEPADESAAALSFEGALEQLEATVGQLEEGEMPLEDALALFEKGVTLSRQCTATLEAAEKRIEILVADRDGKGGFGVEPFETGDVFDASLEEDEEDDDEDEDFDLD